MINLRRKRKVDLSTNDPEMTSLLDVLFIILIFILVGFSESNISVPPIKDLSLPYSQILGIPKDSINISLNGNGDLFLEDKLIVNISVQRPTFEVLSAQLTSYLNKSNYDQKKDKKDLDVNLFIDQKSVYEDLDLLLSSLNMLGFTKHKFVVRGL